MVAIFFFFFQAEDGIRDIGVTGVQTCALPITRGSVALARRTEPTAAMNATEGLSPSRSVRCNQRLGSGALPLASRKACSRVCSIASLRNVMLTERVYEC